MAFLGEEGKSTESKLWSSKSGLAHTSAPRILIGSIDRNVGESYVLLLGLKKYPSRLATNEVSVLTVYEQWRPQVLFLDTRLGGSVSSGFAGTLIRTVDTDTALVIAMSSCGLEENEPAIRNAGYDGYLRRPCLMRQMAEILDKFFTRE